MDGARPAVAWVSSLPRGWTKGHERLVLLVLACDAYDDTSAPGGEDLTQWTGLTNGRLYDTLKSLQEATEIRPALIERVDGALQGVPLPQQGRSRSAHRRGRSRASLGGSPGRAERPSIAQSGCTSPGQHEP